MLILKRRVGERVRINDDITILVTEVRCGDETWVKLGIEAPTNIEVHREEVWKKIQQERQDG